MFREYTDSQQTDHTSKELNRWNECAVRCSQACDVWYENNNAFKML